MTLIRFDIYNHHEDYGDYRRTKKSQVYPSTDRPTDIPSYHAELVMQISR